MPNLFSCSRMSSPTVPRSSPTMITLFRTLSSARIRSRSSDRSFTYTPRFASKSSGIQNRRKNRITWSIRSAPPCFRFLRMLSTKRR